MFKKNELLFKTAKYHQISCDHSSTRNTSLEGGTSGSSWFSQEWEVKVHLLILSPTTIVPPNGALTPVNHLLLQTFTEAQRPVLGPLSKDNGAFMRKCHGCGDNNDVCRAVSEESERVLSFWRVHVKSCTSVWWDEGEKTIFLNWFYFGKKSQNKSNKTLIKVISIQVLVWGLEL